MRLSGVELLRIAIPFRTEIGTAAGTHRVRPLLFVRVVTDEGEGWGECAALEGGTSVDPDIAAVSILAEGVGARRLIDACMSRGGEMPLAAEIAQLFGSSPADRLLAAVFEMAVTDVELRAGGHSLAEALELEPGFEAVPAGAAVGIPIERDLGVVRAQVEAAVAAGSRRVRLKIEPEWDIEPVRAVRQAFPDLLLHVDANGSYGMDDVDHLNLLHQFDLVCLEQPLPPSDLMALAEMARQLELPVALDESLTTPRRVLDAVRNGACQVACLKPARLGGLRATRTAHATCLEADIPVFIGGFFEAGLGRAANLALAGRLQQDAPGLVGDFCDPATYLGVDPCGYPPVHEGWVRVPTQPGVGTWPDEVVVGDLSPTRRWLPATYT